MGKDNTYSSKITSTISKVEPVIVSPFKSSWTLWSHHINDKNWDNDSYSKICEVKTPDHLKWLIENFPPLDEYILYFMRDDILPIWEAPENIKGGCFSFKLSKKQYRQIWIDICKSIIYDKLTVNPSLSNTLTGLSINPRTNTIKIWNNDSMFNQLNYISPSIHGIDFKGGIYKVHDINSNINVNSVITQKSTEQKISIILQKLNSFMSKIVKSNIDMYIQKIIKMEELFGEDIMIKVFDKFVFIDPTNENEYIYIPLRLRIIYGLKSRQRIYKLLFDKYIEKYNTILKEIPVDEDLNPKNILDMEENGCSEEEVNRNIYITECRNLVKCISNMLYYYMRINLLESEGNFWDNIIDDVFNNNYNPYLVYEGVLRLIVKIKPKLSKNILTQLNEYREREIPRKIKFTVNDIITFLQKGTTSPLINDLTVLE